MPDPTITQFTTPARPRRRSARAMSFLGLVPDKPRDETRHDQQQDAEELVDDLITLVEAGLITPVREHGALRYAPSDPDNPAA